MDLRPFPHRVKENGIVSSVRVSLAAMKKALLAVGGIVLVVVIAIGVAMAVTFMGRKPVMPGLVVGGITIVEDGFVTVGVVPIGNGRVALIDAGNDADGLAVLAELSRRHVTADAVSAILLTHGHPDHLGAVKQFPKAQVMALEREVPIVEGREGARSPVQRLMPVSATGITVGRALRDHETVMIGDVAVRVYAVPGHTAGSAAYLVNGVLFVGDSADADDEGGLREAPWVFSESQDENRASLVRLYDRLMSDMTPVIAIAPAHSGVLTDGLAALERFATAN